MREACECAPRVPARAMNALDPLTAPAAPSLVSGAAIHQHGRRAARYVLSWLEAATMRARARRRVPDGPRELRAAQPLGSRSRLAISELRRLVASRLRHDGHE